MNLFVSTITLGALKCKQENQILNSTNHNDHTVIDDSYIAGQKIFK